MVSVVSENGRSAARNHSPRTDVVITTISGGAFLEPFVQALRDRPVRLIIIPDLKTPPAIYQACEQATAAGVDVVCPTPDEQHALLEKLGAGNLIPWNSDNRRNVGYLLAWLGDADIVVSMDDDNLPLAPDFIDRHSVVTAGPDSYEVVSSTSGYFNACSLLETTPAGIFPRGYPYRHRVVDTEVTTTRANVDVRINAGLWLGDPDVDAITRLAVRPVATAYSGRTAVLAADTWCPINSQNTALHRDAIPAYYFARMGYPVNGWPIDRYGDIFSGYFVQACAKHLGHGVRFGDPVVDHPRNPHDLLADLAGELSAILMIEEVVDHLREARLDGSDYRGAYLSLSHLLQDVAERSTGLVWTPQARGFLHQTAHLMRAWLRMLDTAAGA